MKRMTALCLAGVFAAGLSTHAATFNLDQAHTYVGFSVRHMVVSSTKGSFKDFEGTIHFDPADPSSFNASAVIQVASIDTANERRDNHLRSDDFFDAEAYPTMTFVTTGVSGTLPDLTLTGDLTIRGTTKEINLPITVHGPITDPWGAVRIGFDGETTINRQDFGVSWNNVMETGGLVVGDDVKIILSVEAIAATEDEAEQAVE